MQELMTNVWVTVAGLMLLSCHAPGLNAQEAVASDMVEEATLAAASAPKTHFLIIGKGKITDPKKQQQRAIVAVQKIAQAASSAHREAIVSALSEHVMTVAQYRRGEAKENVTGTVFKEHLTQLATTVSPQDTVVIYTHSHGRKNGFEESQPLGGIVMDLPVRKPEHGGTLLWDEYADLLLKIPAKNVVVLTMSCFSGGLVDHLESQRVRERWKDRRQNDKCNLIILTSQNKNLISSPIVKDDDVINPFTFAVVKALAGQADGCELIDGEPAKPGRKDGKLSVGELIDYILYTTENMISEAPGRKNIAKPQLTGSFNRGDVILELVEVPISDTSNGNTAQQDAPVDADKPRR